ncbi:MAG: CPBP family intramembrane metalloprotease [Acidimicrobiia bacterium]|nr:CPBP family intramembrane metalloprotease [Acidimicrobiia bacterium]
MSNDVIVWIGLVAAAVLLVVSGRRRVPGIGILGSVVIVLWFIWNRDDGLADLGFVAPDSWPVTIVAAIVLGTLIQLASVAVFEPLVEARTGEPHDHSIVDSVKGNWLALVQWLVVVWVFVAAIEEVLYRGFMLGQISDLLGGGVGADLIALIVSSVVFGLSHSYQGRSGGITTGLVGALLGLIFLAAGNIWLPILTHGVIDTVGLLLIAKDKVEPLQRPLASRLSG